MRILFVSLAVVLLASCSKKPTETSSEAAVNPAPVDYSPRIGVAVRTAARTCVAIHNAAVLPNSPITLVAPTSPQIYAEAQITGQSPSACPITQDVAPGVTSYEISVPGGNNLPKLAPLIGIVGSAASSGFLVENVNVEADLDQTHNKNTFRACGATDGIHLTVWRGIPVTGTLIWSGYYYEPGNPGTLPTCAAAELTGPIVR